MLPENQFPSLSIEILLAGYRSGLFRPADVVEQIYRWIRGNDDHVWISVIPRETALARAKELEALSRDLPLYGVPFAVKDNIDVAAMETTAGCPGFAYTAEHSAPVVERLIDAGAILVGKTNLDQFATGLVGVRSPYGVPRNPFDEKYIPGGSSSGSAVAVSSGLVSFALGTDTAGSGRVPAALGNIVGMKPTRGWLSTRGSVPACRSLDCISIMTLTCADAARVAEVAGGFDAADPFSRQSPHSGVKLESPATFRFGVPAPAQLQFFGNTETPELFERARRNLEAVGGVAVDIDYSPFSETAVLLYSGPWVAERWAALGNFVAEQPDALYPATRCILEDSQKYSAGDAFAGSYKLATLRRKIEPVWNEVDILLLPTAGTTYTVREVEADPFSLNSNLGYYTNFLNLLDLCGVAVPHSFTTKGLPFGVSLIAPAWQDSLALSVAARLHRTTGIKLGATSARVPVAATESGFVTLAVVGAHLRGQPLNWQLQTRGARFVRACRTANVYRLYALAGGLPARPGLVRVPANGAAIEVEVWELSLEAFGSFTNAIPPPLAIGSVILDSDEIVKGFVCEPIGVDGARDITHFGGWRAFVAESAEVKSP